jgi:non-canonical purine NTP pyrophosphatase (RdgB/HAM1 family)
VFVTSSPQKVSEAERILGRKLLHENLDLPEIQSLRLEKVIEQKARTAYDRLGQRPVIVEDTALFIDCWNGLPGPLIRWFEETVGPAGICLMLDGFKDRRARAQTIIAAYDGSIRLFSGEVKGEIADSPRGDQGFGWDRIFIPEEESRTFGEMSPSEKDQLSMRMKAFQDFAQAERDFHDEHRSSAHLRFK